MNTMSDNIQELLERGKIADGEALSGKEKEELASYQQLFTILDHEPDINIPPGFSGKTIKKIQDKRDAKKEIWLNALFVILVSGFLFYLPLIINNDSIKAIATTFYEYKWIAVFVLLLMFVYFTGGILKHRKG